MRLKFIITAAFVFTILLSGCEETITRHEKDSGNGPSVMYIDDPVLLDSSGEITTSNSYGDTCEYDVSGVDLIQSGEYNDFDFTYITPSSCDRNVFVYNNNLDQWDQLAFDPPPGTFCAAVPTEQEHLFSSRGFTADDYVNIQGKLLIRWGFEYCGIIRALSVNPRYYSLPFGGRHLTIRDGDLMVLDTSIRRITFSGEIVEEFSAPSDKPTGLAYDGEYFWMADRNELVFKLDQEMNVLSEFSLPIDNPGSMEYAMGRLWLAEYPSPTPRILVIDPDQSCDSTYAVVDNAFSIPGGGARGIAFDGQHLLVASDRLYKMTVEGKVAKSFPLPVYFVMGIAWDGSTLWMLNLGPHELRTMDNVLSRFRIP